ncbi:molybdate ABC transporter permease subunit [Orrella sp. NBD-18]|uniref:Molybdenum transport system permease n=1 Tax=Sheuella amnicola TaxID=2707330 RepID=A0A6B2R5T9_9BURK|nr:molybdate ABC transporter permease subunit [Sheuella amnicola]HBI84169.1 molybdate ABC transporter permease subunit [Alcaligenaceae bacterium]
MSFLWPALFVTLKLASLTTLILLLLGTPLAWWLARTRSVFKTPLSALVALPMVLPPTVLGFYFLVMMGPDGPIGKLTDFLGIGSLAFTFSGLLFASVIYSLPFVVQPLQAGFASLDPVVLDVASTLRAGPFDRFMHVVVPMCRPAFLTATVMGFAHTVGEFGVILMVGGNIEGQTRVLSVLLYDKVEGMAYQDAHWIAAGLLAFSFMVLLVMHLYANGRHQTTRMS